MIDLLRKEVDTLPAVTAGRATLIVDDDDGLLKWKLEDGTIKSAGGGGFDYILLRDEKASGVAGGTFTNGAWRTRDLNTELTDTGGNCSLAANQFTLVAGIYRARIIVPGAFCDQHQGRLRNVTDGVTLLEGTGEFASTVYFAETHSFIVGRFTVAAAKALEVQHQCNTTSATSGFGAGVTFGEKNIYTVVELWRES